MLKCHFLQDHFWVLLHFNAGCGGFFQQRIYLQNQKSRFLLQVSLFQVTPHAQALIFFLLFLHCHVNICEKDSPSVDLEINIQVFHSLLLMKLCMQLLWYHWCIIHAESAVKWEQDKQEVLFNTAAARIPSLRVSFKCCTVFLH